MPPLIDLSGKVFGRLVVVCRGENTERGQMRWLCWCTCGEVKNIFGSAMTHGSTKSCGCLQKEAGQIQGQRNRRHGRYIYSTPENHAYRAAKNRCENSKDKVYSFYGGRGIKFLFTSFEQFLAEVGPRPEIPGLQYSLDRIDANGHYGPGNVRWATASEQCKNRRPFKSLQNFTTAELEAELERRGEHTCVVSLQGLTEFLDLPSPLN